MNLDYHKLPEEDIKLAKNNRGTLSKCVPHVLLLLVKPHRQLAVFSISLMCLPDKNYTRAVDFFVQDLEK